MEELAHRSNVPTTVLDKVEQGRRSPRVHNLVRLAHGLGIDPGELVKGIAPPDRTGDPK